MQSLMIVMHQNTPNNNTKSKKQLLAEGVCHFVP